MPPEETLYAQFDGDEVEGRRYSLGEPVEIQNPGLIDILKIQGRVGTNRPAVTIVVPAADKSPDDMNRAELEAAARASIDLSHYDDDDLRARLHAVRAEQAGDSDQDEAEGGDQQVDAGEGDSDAGEGEGEGDQSDTGVTDEEQGAYIALKGKDLSDLKADELKLVGKVEGVDLSAATNSPLRIKAIEAHRAAPQG